MGQLKIPLSSFTEEGILVDKVVAETEFAPKGTSQLAISPVHVSGKLTQVDGDYIFKGRLEGLYHLRCDRCLDPVDWPFDIDVLWVFEEGVPVHPLENWPDNAEEEEDAVDEGETRVARFQGNEIDLSEAAWEEIVLAAPAKVLCREDCKGLCPRCGANWNRETCDCQQQPKEESFQNDGLAGLADLFPELKPKNSEE